MEEIKMKGIEKLFSQALALFLALVPALVGSQNIYFISHNGNAAPTGNNVGTYANPWILTTGLTSANFDLNQVQDLSRLNPKPVSSEYGSTINPNPAQTEINISIQCFRWNLRY